MAVKVIIGIALFLFCVGIFVWILQDVFRWR